MFRFRLNEMVAMKETLNLTTRWMICLKCKIWSSICIDSDSAR